MCASPTSRKAEDEFPEGTCTQNTCIYHMYTHIHSWPRGSQIDIQSTHIHRQQQQPHPVPLSGWARWGSMRDSICTHTYELDPSNSLVQTLSLPAAVPASQSPQLLALAHTIPKATAPLQLLVQMTAHTHTHTELTRTHLSSIPGHWGSGSPGTDLGGVRKTHPFPSSAVLPCSSGFAQVGFWWSDGTCNEPRDSWARVFFRVLPIPLSLCSLVDVQMSFYHVT